MSDVNLLLQAARNNAEWCEIVCSSHGLPGRFTDDIWLNSGHVPMFYPNAVTLTPDNSNKLTEQIRQLLKTRDGAWSVKDSFNNLDLSVLGFNKLFDGEWLLVPEPTEVQVDKWLVVDSQATLSDWETAWCNGESTGLFKPVLLNDERVRFLALYEDEKIIAGAILNRSEQVVGISNIFYPSDRSQQYLKEIIGISKQLFPDLPIIGYESGTELLQAKTAGFSSLGNLSVWLKEE